MTTPATAGGPTDEERLPVIPPENLTRWHAAIADELRDAFEEVLPVGKYTMGKQLAAFEQEFAAYSDSRHGIGISSGTAALHVALRALGVGPGDEVITVPNTYVATVFAITYTGATPVFVDCDPVTYNIDPAKIEAAITDKTRAIVPVHLYGQPTDMDPILEIAKKHDLYVIEDAAQAHGATYKGQKIGNFGKVSCFSFYPGKNLGAYGDAGGICTDDAELATTIRKLSDHGSNVKYQHDFEGVNSRMDGIQGAVLSVKLRHLDKWTERRIEVARKYSEGLKDVCVTPVTVDHVRHVFHLYVIQVNNRDEVMNHLQEQGIASGIHYPVPLPATPAYAHLGYNADQFPVAYGIADKIVSLPMHGDLTDEDVDLVIAEVKKVAK